MLDIVDSTNANPEAKKDGKIKPSLPPISENTPKKSSNVHIPEPNLVLDDVQNQKLKNTIDSGTQAEQAAAQKKLEEEKKKKE